MWNSYFFNKIYPNVGGYKFSRFSTLYTKVINLIPIVVLTPIIIQALMFDKNDEIIKISFEIICGVLAILISILFKNVMITILLTMIIFLILTNIPFFNG